MKHLVYIFTRYFKSENETLMCKPYYKTGEAE